MSKRHGEPQYYNNENKKAKLSVYACSESLPSTNRAINNTATQNFPNEDDVWGDDDDDEILLLASQVCEQQNFNMSMIADYTRCMRPPLTSTQKSVICAEQGSSKTAFETSISQIEPFKKPSVPERFENGIETNELNSADLRNLNPVFERQFQHLIKELRLAKAANDKLRHEHEMLTDKYLFKEGEATILRTQIKNAQSQSDAARLQRLKVEEKKQMVWNEKMQAMEKEILSMKAQIEFKSLEESNLKEKCRLLENSRIKLTEPMAPTRHKWPSFSQKMNSPSARAENDVRHSSAEGSSQTCSVELIQLKTNPVYRYPILEEVPKSIFHHSPLKETQIVFSSNKESLFVEHSSFSSIRKRILNEYSDKSSRGIDNDGPETNVEFGIVYEHISKLMEIHQDDFCGNNLALEHAIKVTLIVKEFLLKTLRRLQDLSATVTPQTLREMDTRYLDLMMHNPDIMTDKDLFHHSPWCENEQSIDTRRLLAVLAAICNNSSAISFHILGLLSIDSMRVTITDEFVKSLPLCIASGRKYDGLIDIFIEIGKKIGFIGCSHLYPGLLTAISMVLKQSLKRIDEKNIVYAKVFEFLNEVVLLRPNARVLLEILDILKELSPEKEFLEMLCKNVENSNVELDYSQGVALYNSDTCFLQVLCCQMEVWTVKHEQDDHLAGLSRMADCIVSLLHSAGHQAVRWAGYHQENKCSCSLRVHQCMLVILHRCAKLYRAFSPYLNDENLRKSVSGVLRGALLLLGACETPGPPAGDFLSLLEIIGQVASSLRLKDEHREALDVLNTNLSLPIEDIETPIAEAKDIWEKSFDNFFITD